MAEKQKLPRVSRVERLWIRWWFLIDEQLVERIPTRTQNEEWDELHERNCDTDHKSGNDDNLENAYGHEEPPRSSGLKKVPTKDVCLFI